MREVVDLTLLGEDDVDVVVDVDLTAVPFSPSDALSSSSSLLVVGGAVAPSERLCSSKEEDCNAVVSFPGVAMGFVRVSGDDALLVLREKSEYAQLAGFNSDSAKVENAPLFCDPRFPANAESIEGSERRKKRKRDDGKPPACRCGSRCGVAASKNKQGPNFQRKYFYCAARACSFFCWAEPRKGQQYHWKRFPSFVLVTDYGFSADDLMQGGVGDCWFLSALAVVAERHDLIAKLFESTAPSKDGKYAVRLFLDGAWRRVVVDDRLPCTSNPRRAERTFGTGLAFSRASNNQLWVSILQKAYA